MPFAVLLQTEYSDNRVDHNTSDQNAKQRHREGLPTEHAANLIVCGAGQTQIFKLASASADRYRKRIDNGDDRK